MDIAKTKSGEIWKSPPSLKRTWIEVSNLGRIRTLNHESRFYRLGYQSRRKCKGRIRRPEIFVFSRTTHGERIVKGRLLRCLVAECFLPDYRPDLYVFHKNGDIGDCRAENLRMGTKAEKYAKAGASSSTIVVEVKKDGQTVGVFNGCGAAARFLGVTKQSVWEDVRVGRKCKGYQLVATPKLRKTETIRQTRLEQILREMLICQE